MNSALIELVTGDKVFTDLTSEVQRFVSGCTALGSSDGLCNVFIPHATAGVAIFELHAGTETDVAEVLSRMFPKDDRWRHRHGSHGHGADHVLPAFVSPSITLPVIEGEVALGTWQYVVLVDTNGDNPRRNVRLSFIAG